MKRQQAASEFFVDLGASGDAFKREEQNTSRKRARDEEDNGGDLDDFVFDFSDKKTGASRYFADEDEDDGVFNHSVCGICSDPGHIARDCSHDQCMVCGVIDADHRAKDCPVTQFVHPSWRGGPRCSSCGGGNHPEEVCPTIWRRYDTSNAPNLSQNQTIDLDAEPDSDPFPLLPRCFNCASSSHWGDNCPFPRGHPMRFGEPSAFGDHALSSSQLKKLNRQRDLGRLGRDGSDGQFQFTFGSSTTGGVGGIRGANLPQKPTPFHFTAGSGMGMGRRVNQARFGRGGPPMANVGGGFGGDEEEDFADDWFNNRPSSRVDRGGGSRDGAGRGRGGGGFDRSRSSNSIPTGPRVYNDSKQSRYGDGPGSGSGGGGAGGRGGGGRSGSLSTRLGPRPAASFDDPPRYSRKPKWRGGYPGAR